MPDSIKKTKPPAYYNIQKYIIQVEIQNNKMILDIDYATLARQNIPFTQAAHIVHFVDNVVAQLKLPLSTAAELKNQGTRFLITLTVPQRGREKLEAFQTAFCAAQEMR